MSRRGVSPSRARAVETLRRVLEKGEPATPLLTTAAADLSPEDADLTREIVLGVLRNRSRLDRELARFSRVPLGKLAPNLREILEVGLYQIRFLERVPDYAAVDEAVRQARASGGEGAARLVNAVLRSALRGESSSAEDEEPEGGAEELAVRFSHPEFLVARWLERFGREATDAILRADNASSPLDLMVNPRKIARDRLAGELRAEGIETEASALSPLALTVRSGNPLRSPFFSAGFFSVQDVGAQALAQLLPSGETLVDLAAAPGGKSFAGVALQRFRRAIALDRSPARLLKVREAASRLSMPEVLPAAGDFLTPPLPARSFDRVLFDAPCSGTGTLRKNPEIRYRVTSRAIERLSRTQEDGLVRAAELLEPGGYLLYSTCSLEWEENERVVERVLALDGELEPSAIEAPEAPEALRPFVKGPRFRMLPGRDNDGFTAHLLRRRASRTNKISRPMASDKPIPMLDLTRYDESLKRQIARGVEAIFATGRFVMGPAHDAFEASFAREIGAAHAIGVSSGTDALLVSLMALGVGPGDEVITTPFTFFASAGAIARLNARPVFVDIDPATFNLDPDRLEAAITPRTKAIEPVDLYGQCADMDPILEIAGRRGVPVLEDACQAVGATYRGRRAGTFGRLAAFSFYPTKNLGAAGDAGAVTTDDDDLARVLRSLRLHGSAVTYQHDRVGGNFRLDAIQAAVLTAKLPRLAAWNERRRMIAARYRELFAEAARAGRITPPAEAPGRRHVYHQYVVRVPDRDGVRKRLTERGIATAVFYPIPLHLQECFAGLGYREGDFPESEKAAREVLALPVFPELTDEEVERVAEEVLAALIRKA